MSAENGDAPATDGDRALKAARRQHELLVGLLPGVTYVLLLDPGTGRPDRFAWLGPRAIEVLGEDVVEVVAGDASAFLERVPFEERGAFVGSMMEGFGSGEPQTVEHRYRREDGSWSWLRHHARAVADPLSGTVAMYGIMLDVTEEGIARSRTELLSRVVEQAANVVIITNADGAIEYVNPAFETVTGYSKEEVIGRNPSMLQGGKLSRAYYRTMWDELRAGRSWEAVFENRKKDGTLYRQKSTISPVTDRYGVLRYVGIAQDVTRVHALEEYLALVMDPESSPGNPRVDPVDDTDYPPDTRYGAASSGLPQAV